MTLLHLRASLWSLVLASPRLLPSLCTWAWWLIPLTSRQSGLFPGLLLQPQGSAVASRSTLASTRLSQRHPLFPKVPTSSHLLHLMSSAGVPHDTSAACPADRGCPQLAGEPSSLGRAWASSPASLGRWCLVSAPVFGLSWERMTHAKGCSRTMPSFRPLGTPCF